MSVATLRRLALGLIASTWCLGCGGAKAVREYTYPPDFAYIEKSQLNTTMGSLATQSRQLNELLRADSSTGDSNDRAIALLEGMLASVDDLAGSAQHSNHPLLNAHLRTFRQDLQLALDGARAAPPNYYLAGSVATSCTYCHH